jgi:hypothetical protein
MGGGGIIAMTEISESPCISLVIRPATWGLMMHHTAHFARY